MLGLILTLLFVAAVTVAVMGVSKRALTEFDPLERVGVSGLVGLGAVGTLTFFVGSVPGGLGWGLWVVVGLVVALAGLALVRLKPEWPTLNKQLSAASVPLLVVGLLATLPLTGVLAPSDTMDWDSLAYHLAVPKLWLEAGQIQLVPFIHHSHFPFAVDNLFLYGLSWGGEHGAKVFMWAGFVLGLAAVYGVARRWFGAGCAPWATLAYGAVPVLLWESGTAYIDVVHGLYAGLGAIYAVDALRASPERTWFWARWAAITMGLAIGSKYTGLQTTFAVCLVLGCGLLVRRAGVRAVTVGVGTGLLALLIGSPWYVRNAVQVGNPVFPFFYEQLGGEGWDSWRAEIYRDEQQTFGVGRTDTGRDVTQIGHAILGLAYQPGRYVNPGQTEGRGFPMGAVGVPLLLGAILWLGGRRVPRRVWAVLAIVGITLGMWFFLSQQSRYIASIALPLAVIGGGAFTGVRAGRLFAGVCVLQAAVSFYVLNALIAGPQRAYVLGGMDRAEYLKQRGAAFAENAAVIDERVGSDGRVALFDEVFGYFLNVPYMWGNPGHSMLIPYESMETAEDFVEGLRGQGITHVYVNLGYGSPEDLGEWVAAMGVRGPAVPYAAERRAELMPDLNWRWKILLAEASAQGLIEVEEGFGGALLFRVAGP